METSHPGVYIQEVSSGDRPIEGARTSTTAFIGVTEKGPVDHALMVTSFAEFQANFGNFLRENWLAYSVLQFFNNGGIRLYIARVTGHESTAPQELDYQKAFALLDPITDINLVAVPGIGSPSMVSYGADYCQKRGDCFFVGDMSLSDNTKEKVQIFFYNIEIKSSYAAVYFPWLKMKDPNGASPEPIAVPPSGSVAGIYARMDADRGVWKASAGKEAILKGITALSVTLTNAEIEELNMLGCNCLRAISPAGSVVVWGARTLHGNTESSSEWKYIPVRRTAIFIEESLYQGTQWVVFEPNDEPLWAQIRLNVGAYMMSLFRQGAFQGTNPKDAFFVKCGKETTTQDDVNKGIVNIMVGFAPLKPAEFVIIKIQQLADQVET